jgi:esterase/lipase
MHLRLIILVCTACVTSALVATRGRVPLSVNYGSISGQKFTLSLSRGQRTSLGMLKEGVGRNLAYETTEGTTLSYDYFPSSSRDKPIMYLPGLIRQKNEAKATNLQAFCRRNDLTYLCADYLGVGRSSGDFSDGSVGQWASDTITIIENILADAGKVVLVGHGVGAWVSMLVASRRPDLISGVVGLSADPDFTEELLWKSLPEDKKNEIMAAGVAEITWGKDKYKISKKLIEDGRENLLLNGEPGSIPVKCPVRLVHALNDEEVPYALALKLAENCASTDTSVCLVKGSSHALDREVDMKTMRAMIIEVLDAFKGEFDLRSPGSG